MVFRERKSKAGFLIDKQEVNSLRHKTHMMNTLSGAKLSSVLVVESTWG